MALDRRASVSRRSRRPIALDDGVLTLGVSNGPWGAQVQFLHEEIRRKADEALGGDKVRSVRIVVRSVRRVSGPRHLRTPQKTAGRRALSGHHEPRSNVTPVR